MLTEELFQFNRWANLAVVDHCAQVPTDLLDAPPPPGMYGTIRATLIHLANAEIVYVSRLRGEEPQRLPSDVNLEVLRASLVRTGEALLELARTTLPGKLLTFHSPMLGQVTTPAWVILAQALVHGCDHRSQLAAIFTQLGAPLPELDVWHFAGVIR